MKNENVSPFSSVKELETQRAAIENRIKSLQTDLKLPLSQDSEEQALQLSNRVVLTSLLETEKSMLAQVNQAIKVKS